MPTSRRRAAGDVGPHVAIHDAPSLPSATAPSRDSLLEDALARREESEAVAEIARALAGATRDLPQALLLLTERTGSLLSAEGACVAQLIEDDVFRFHAAWGTMAPLSGTTRATTGSLARVAIETRLAVISNNVSADNRGDPQLIEEFGVRQLATAPMIVKDGAVGVLLAINSARGEFTPAEGSLLQRLADHGAVAVRNAQLLHRAERSAREAKALEDIVQEINRSLETDQVFSLIARHAAELLGARGAGLGMIEGSEFVVVAGSGLTEGAVGRRVPLQSAFASECMRTMRPVRISDLHAQRNRWPLGAQQVTAERPNALAVPLVAAGGAIGAIVVFGKDSGDFNAQDEALLGALASHASIAIENARLYRASLLTMRHASILATSARSLAMNITPEATYADIGRMARTSLRADGVAIYLADPVTRAVDLPFSIGAGTPITPLMVETFWDAAWGEAVRTGMAVFRGDIRQFGDEQPMQLLNDEGVVSIALLPLISEGGPRGLLSLRYLTTQLFEPEQQSLLIDFATHVAVAMRNASLFADLERRAGRLRAVAQVQQAISAAMSPLEVYAEIYKAVASVVDSPCFALLSYDDQEAELVPEYVINDTLPVPVAELPRFPLANGMTSQAFRTGEPNITARSRMGWTGQMHHADHPRAIAVVMSAPIVHGDKVLGVMQAQSYRHDAYDWDDLDLVMMIARQAGTAISRAHAFAAERREREQAEAAAAIARLALRAATVDEVASELLNVVEGVVQAAGTALIVMHADGTALRIAAAHGCSSHLIGTRPRFTPGSLRAVSPPSYDSPERDTIVEIRSEPVSGASCSPEVVVPLTSGDRVIGALQIVPDVSARSGVRDIATLRRLAAPVALALDTLLLREEERRQHGRQQELASALETLEQPVFVFAPNATIHYANGAALREYQYSLAELIGLPARRLAIEASSSPSGTAHDEPLEHILRPGEQLQRRRDGSEFPAWVILSPIRQGAELVGTVATVRNLTDERRLAEQHRQTERLAALGELVAGVAHEVNNPLAGISAMSQILQEDELSTDQREAVGLIRREADRAAAVIRDLLTFARKTGPRIVSIDINDLIDQTLRLRAYSLRSVGISVETRFDSALHRVEGDDRQLQQVLLNLVVNAEHALAGANTRVLSLSTRNEFDRVVIEVADSGPGMSASVQHRIFEPFFTTKPEGQGTGLGLSVSYGIVQTHGGMLTVHSAPGAGATFRISLPAEPSVPVHSTNDSSP
ncbi:MAG: GAF domain-containing protein [Gemmatimonadaceae bacterium]